VPPLLNRGRRSQWPKTALLLQLSALFGLAVCTLTVGPPANELRGNQQGVTPEGVDSTPTLVTPTLQATAAGVPAILTPVPSTPQATRIPQPTPLAGSDGPSTVAPTPTSFQVDLTLDALPYDPQILDPSRGGTGEEATVIRQVFEPLMRFDQNLTPQPAAAATYEIKPDGKTYTFHLRPDGRWSDGKPVTAEQFEYSWKRVLSPTVQSSYAIYFVRAGIVGAAAYNLGQVATPDAVGIHALDDRTLEINLIQPYGPLPYLAALWVASPLRPDIVDANPSWAEVPSTYTGNGAFVLQEWVHGDYLTLVPNAHYVQHDRWPKPALQRIVLHISSDPIAEFDAYVSGQRAWAVVPTSRIPNVSADPSLLQQTRQYPDLGVTWLQLNTARAPFDNPLVRKAFSRAIDRQTYVRTVSNGVGQSATSLIPPGMPGFHAELGKNYDFNPDGAKQLLREAGYPDGQALPAVTFRFPRIGEEQQRATFFQTQLQQNLGVSINIESMEISSWTQALNARDFQMGPGGLKAAFADAASELYPSFTCGAKYNLYGYCNKGFDQLFDKAVSLTLEQRSEQYVSAQQILIEDMPVIPISFPVRLVISRSWVQHLTVTPLDSYPGELFLDGVTVAPH
jgi:oligopeptide transport system substrate-binding protein